MGKLMGAFMDWFDLTRRRGNTRVLAELDNVALLCASKWHADTIEENHPGSRPISLLKPGYVTADLEGRPVVIDMYTVHQIVEEARFQNEKLGRELRAAKEDVMRYETMLQAAGKRRRELIKELAGEKRKRHEIAEQLMDDGSVDGTHHKQWAIDQAVGALYEGEYDEKVAEWCAEDGDPNAYEWDTGVEP